MHRGSDKRRRVLAVASGGGHWVQLLRLRPAWTDCDVTYVSVHQQYAATVAGHRYYCVPDATRWDKLRMACLALIMLWIVLRSRPDVVITTGAAPGLFGILWGRLIGARALWLDSIANIEHLSLSGQQASAHADVVLTQWPELQSAQIRYWGRVL